MNVLMSISDWFWNEEIWLPPNTTWADRVSTPENQLPKFMDLWTYPFYIAASFIFLRYFILNPFVFSPIAVKVGIRNVKPKTVVPVPVLEKIFAKYRKNVPEKVILDVAEELQWSERKVERWLRARLAMNHINTHTKFIECAWQFTYYTFAFIFGVFCLHNKPWLYDINHCWIGYPYNKLDTDVWFYYMFSLGFYWSMTFTHFYETRRKDFYQMFFHHLLTIALMVFSFTCNFVRVGSLMLLVHDVADIPLQMSKMLIYLEWKKLCDAVFAFFSILWIITRCGIYPLWIVSNTLFYAANLVPMHPVYYIFNVLLCSLAVLHYYWTYFILRIIVNTAVKGKVEDDRSSSDWRPPSEDGSDGVLKRS
ncbi:ceramide synthase 6-like [Hyalella azteca]|uniref:Ceramide synthase 6-like n=2 Tax=Hyalella azteca TaxID=294128 RepID=A0A8B7MZA4_HYAAZ|nr:ceramide synthase 6-like [Hyalella azteca]